MSEAANLRDTIVPKSDQLNADDLLAGPIIVRILGVARGDKEQPVSVKLVDRLPYKPCKSMRRVLIAAWGDDGHKWVGRSMTLFCDPEVAFGGVKVGGIRISHLSHIDGPLQLALTVTRGQRKPYVVHPLREEPVKPAAEKKLTPLQVAMAGAKERGWTKEQVLDLLQPYEGKPSKVPADKVGEVIATLAGAPPTEDDDDAADGDDDNGAPS